MFTLIIHAAAGCHFVPAPFHVWAEQLGMFNGGWHIWNPVPAIGRVICNARGA
jgi:hypothetical protein